MEARFYFRRMKYLKFIIFFLCGYLNLFAQIHFEPEVEYLDLRNNNQVKVQYVDAELNYEDIIERDFSETIADSILLKSRKALWIKFDFQNHSDQDENIYIFSQNSYIEAFLQNENLSRYRNGFLTPFKERDFIESTNTIALNFKAQEQKTIILRLQDSRMFETPVDLGIGSELVYYKYLRAEQEYNQPTEFFSVFYFSALLIVFIYIVMIYLLNREQVYLYYLFYVFFQMLYTLFSYPGHPIEFLNISHYYPNFALISSEPIQFTFVGFYVLFIINLLHIQKGSLLGKVMYGLTWACFIYAVAIAIGYSFTHSPNTKFYAFRISRGIILPVNFILIIWIVRTIKHPLIYYFVIAHLFFFAGAVSSVYILLNKLFADPNSIFYFMKSTDVVFQSGLLGEVICFSFALSLRVRLVQAEKRRSTRAFIEQLKENEIIQQNMNKELDRKVNEKTEELLQAYLEMEKQREKEIKMEFTQKLNEMETLALRSQMNPHFLFNSMNAIKHLMMIDRSEDAIYYLNDFSVLLRNVLQNSQKHTISVGEELEVLRLYLSMEKIRLGEEFNFELNVPDSDVLDEYCIPGLILQPIAENAIWHGLIPSGKKEKKLQIRFDLHPTLVISIQDNGIGREKSLKNKEDQFNLYDSMGLKIIRDRLALFNHAHEMKIEMQIEDLEENEEPSGTLVTFTYINSTN